MERVAVESSWVKAVGFDAVAAVMEVELVVPDGAPAKVYLCEDGGPIGELARLHALMMQPGESVGRIFNSHIKNNPDFIVTMIEAAA
jgi:hypothetical protein